VECPSVGVITTGRGAPVPPLDKAARHATADRMAKAIRGTTKKKGRGRPKTTGRGVSVHMRLHPNDLGPLDEWAAANGCTRAEALRRLTRIGLETEVKRKQ
jgi:hypothetical protein